MTEDAEEGSKTEEPTERKIQDAADKGNVPFSRDAVTLGSLLAVLLTLKVLSAWAAAGLATSLATFLELSGFIRLGAFEDAPTVLASQALEAARFLIPLLMVIAAGGIAAALLQNVPRASAERIRPKLSRISPSAGWRRIFGRSALVEFAKALVKLVAVMATAALVLKANSGAMQDALHSPPGLLPGMLLAITVDLLSALCAIALALAVFDVAWSRFEWRQGLRMTREEIKEEFRQMEGDPHLKARARGLARQRVSSKMFAKLPTATMMITNPTHYAVALRYVQEERGVPVVVAKGLDHLALRLREAAVGNGIPLVENRPLARSLYDQVEVDEAIPPDLYRAVAEVIHFLQVRGAARPGLHA